MSRDSAIELHLKEAMAEREELRALLDEAVELLTEWADGGGWENDSANVDTTRAFLTRLGQDQSTT